MYRVEYESIFQDMLPPWWYLQAYTEMKMMWRVGENHEAPINFGRISWYLTDMQNIDRLIVDT
jgi:hypothetical protein